MEILDNEVEGAPYGQYLTGYEWCIEAKLRPLDLSQWNLDFPNNAILSEEQFFETPISKDEFIKTIANCNVKPNSLPRKTEKYLTYMMYGLVPYNLSPIQQGIQYGHAVQEYNNSFHASGKSEDKFWKWAFQDKAFSIMNGGTTNLNPNKLGTLNKYLETLKANDILTFEFYEEDLGDQLTAVVFLVDERVWDYKENYPDYEKTLPTWPRRNKPTTKQLEEYNALETKNYAAWVDKIGGEKNVFLRNFLRPLRRA